MQAIILAAGMGKRLKELTQNNTKCMIKVNGISLIERMLHQIEKQNVNQIVIVVGYEHKKLADYISTLNIKTPIIYVNNPIYDKTNNIYSLALAKDYLCQDDTLLFESDLIFDDAVIECLVNDPRETLAVVDKYERWMDGTCVKLSENDEINAFIPGKEFKYNEKESYYKTVNIYKFSKHFSTTKYVPFLEAYLTALGENEYYEQVLKLIVTLDTSEIWGMRLKGQRWYEIDDVQDLSIASVMFATDENKRVSEMQSRNGGYWRFPKMVNFSSRTNSYFPPQKLMDEIKASFETLLKQKPSDVEVNRLLGAKIFGIKQEHIIVGNDVSEIIRCIAKKTKGKNGLVNISLENELGEGDKENSVRYMSNNENLSYDATDLVSFYQNKRVKMIVLANPDNFGGNYIPKNSILELIDWCQKNEIRIIVDESYSDFAGEKDNTLITEDILSRYRNLIVTKSISKSYGVAGAELGVLATFDMEIIRMLQNEKMLWNINAFGEYFLQIEEKYKKDYLKSVQQVINERKQFEKELKKNTALHVIPSKANYVTLEIVNGVKAKDLTKRLLAEHNLLIKDLSNCIKTNERQFVQATICSSENNMLLIKALEEELS